MSPLTLNPQNAHVRGPPMCTSYAEQPGLRAGTKRTGWEKELLLARSVPFGTADTCRRMYRSSTLNHSCPVFNFPSAEGHSLSTFAGDGRTPFPLRRAAVAPLLNLISLTEEQADISKNVKFRNLCNLRFGFKLVHCCAANYCSTSSHSFKKTKTNKQ